MSKKRVSEQEFPETVTNEKGQLEYYEGWHKYNPNNVTCPTCNSLDIEFLWSSYRVVGLQCNKCGESILDK